MASNHTLTYKRIRLRIPKSFPEKPVISHLVSEYGLIINIRAAILGADAVGDGWFDLDLRGTTEQIENALSYLHDLQFDIWNENQNEDWWN